MNYRRKNPENEKKIVTTDNLFFVLPKVERSNQAKKAEVRDRLASGDTYWRGNSLWMRDYVGDNKRELEEYAYGYCRGADEIIKPFEIVFYDRNGRSKLKVSCF